LKPSNLLLNANCHLKICDLGLARGYNESDYMTEYVVTRWYRAPEIMCSCEAYDFKIDVWSTGCILAELLMRNPLFPGENYKLQLSSIFSILGTPSKEDMACITNEFALQYLQSMPVYPKVPFEKVLGKHNPKVNPLAIDLLEKMLAFNPKKRYSVDECLAHPYLKELHDPKIEITCQQPWDHTFEKELEDRLLTKAALQEFMWDEIYRFRPYLRGIQGKGRSKKPEEDAMVDDNSSRMAKLNV
jgi:serine/threonine protein kinase